MDDCIELKDARHPDYPNESLDDWLIIQTPKWRIYYKPDDEEGMGFRFFTVEMIGSSTAEIIWAANDNVRYSWWGWAAFDGIRHMYANQDNGYINYPDIDMQIEILAWLKKLDDKYCRD